MQKIFLLFTFILFTLSLVLLTFGFLQLPQSLQFPNTKAAGPHCFQVGCFAYASDTSLFYDGSPLHLFGATMNPATFSTKFGGNDWCSTNFTRYIDLIISAAKESHFNTIRPTDYFKCEGSEGILGHDENPVIWSNMSYLLTQAAANNIFVILDFSAFRNMLAQTNDPYSQTSIDEYWKPFLTYVVQSLNYKDRANIVYYSFAGDVGIAPDTTELIPFYQNISTFIKNDLGDVNHLISTSSLNHTDDGRLASSIWKGIIGLPTIDIVSMSVYTAGDLATGAQQLSTYAHAMHKPFMIEEFGYTQSSGVCTILQNATGCSDANRVLKVKNLFSSSSSYNPVGYIINDLGPEVASTSFDVFPESFPEYAMYPSVTLTYPTTRLYWETVSAFANSYTSLSQTTPTPTIIAAPLATSPTRVPTNTITISPSLSIQKVTVIPTKSITLIPSKVQKVRITQSVIASAIQTPISSTKLPSLTATLSPTPITRVLSVNPTVVIKSTLPSKKQSTKSVGSNSLPIFAFEGGMITLMFSCVLIVFFFSLRTFVRVTKDPFVLG